jgi:hypothetical protein
MSKDTSKQWMVKRSYYGGEGYTPYISDGDSARVLCFMNLSGAYNGYAGKEQAEADARLMAAAPEMLEVLKEIMSWEENEQALWGPKARAAIDKATGVKS